MNIIERGLWVAVAVVFGSLGGSLYQKYGTPKTQPVKYERNAIRKVAAFQVADTFKLNEARAEESVYCFQRQAAVDVIDAGEGGGVILSAHFRTGTCVVMKAMVTYSRVVYKNGAMRVYEGKVGGVTVFNPTDFVAEGETDI